MRHDRLSSRGEGMDRGRVDGYALWHEQPALRVQQGLGRDPHGGEVFCFRGRKGDLIKVLWHDGAGMSLYLKRLEAGKFIWPVSQNGWAVPVLAAQLGYLLEGIDWRNPRWIQRPATAG